MSLGDDGKNRLETVMEESKNPGGRPQYEPTEKAKGVVESAVAFGIPQKDIATHLGIDIKTLTKHFDAELREGVFKAHMKIGGEIYRLATQCADEAVRFRAAAYYAARRMGWKETTAQELSGQDGTPFTITISGPFAGHPA